MKKPKIKITLIDQKGHMGCHRGHRIGDTFDFDTERGKLCPMAMHVAFPYIDILRYGGKLPSQPEGSVAFCCPTYRGSGCADQPRHTKYLQSSCPLRS